MNEQIKHVTTINSKMITYANAHDHILSMQRLNVLLGQFLQVISFWYQYVVKITSILKLRTTPLLTHNPLKNGKILFYLSLFKIARYSTPPCIIANFTCS